MSVLADTRAALKADLEGLGLRVLDYLPETVTPPVVLIGAGDPYVTLTGYGSSATVNVELFLMVKAGDNSVTTDQLDAMIVTIMSHEFGWQIGDASQPFQGRYGSAQYLTASIPLSKSIDLT